MTPSYQDLMRHVAQVNEDARVTAQTVLERALRAVREGLPK